MEFSDLLENGKVALVNGSNNTDNEHAKILQSVIDAARKLTTNKMITGDTALEDLMSTADEIMKFCYQQSKYLEEFDQCERYPFWAMKISGLVDIITSIEDEVKEAAVGVIEYLFNEKGEAVLDMKMSSKVADYFNSPEEFLQFFKAKLPWNGEYRLTDEELVNITLEEMALKEAIIYYCN